jgi:pimeloyl-ACP methyl ester carboxylesterase
LWGTGDAGIAARDPESGVGMHARTLSGHRIHYDDRGRGEPALLLLPGWCVNRTVYDRLAPILARWRRVLTVDWRGHGDSDHARADFGGAALSADARAVIDASGALSVVPVALGNAGWVALELRKLLGARVPAIVLLDWLVVEPPAGFRAALEDLQSPDRWLEARERILADWHAGSEDVALCLADAVQPYGFEMWARAARVISESYAEHRSPLHALTGLHPPVPTLHLFSRSPDPTFLEKQLWFARRHPWFDVEALGTRTHFPMLELPETTARKIEDFVASRALRPVGRQERRRVWA